MGDPSREAVPRAMPYAPRRRSAPVEGPGELRPRLDARRSHGARVTVWKVEGADHTGGYEIQPGEWQRRVLGFLDEHLR